MRRPCTCVGGDGTAVCPRERECFENWLTRNYALTALAALPKVW